jgi:hypothetical protein
MSREPNSSLTDCSTKFYFGVPLRSKEASRDWSQVSDRFRRTIASITRQTVPEFSVLVACHEVPDLQGAADPRVHFIQAAFDPPKADDYTGQMVDKGRKVHLILSSIKQLGIGHYMQVDADDLISRRIVEFVRGRSEVPGWLIRFGFEYQVGTDFVQLNPIVNRHCGTTSIVRLEERDLPEDLTDMDAPDAPARYVLRRAHHGWRRGFAELGRRFRPLPFVGCVYVTGHSDNHSANKPSRHPRHSLSLRKVILLTSPKVKLSARLKQEFALGSDFHSAGACQTNTIS